MRRYLRGPRRILCSFCYPASYWRRFSSSFGGHRRAPLLLRPQICRRRLNETRRPRLTSKFTGARLASTPSRIGLPSRGVCWSSTTPKSKTFSRSTGRWWNRKTMSCLRRGDCVIGAAAAAMPRASPVERCVRQHRRSSAPYVVVRSLNFLVVALQSFVLSVHCIT